MKRFVNVILTILLVTVLLCVGVYAYHGGFQSVTIEEKQMGPFRLVYREMKGTDMKQVGVITDDIAYALTKAGFRTHRPFDVYYPDTRPNEIGFVIASSEEGKLGLLDSSIKTKVIVVQKFMVATFPWKTQLSYIVGYMRVDPALQAHREKRNYVKSWAATLHDDDTITYLQPLVSR